LELGRQPVSAVRYPALLVSRMGKSGIDRFGAFFGDCQASANLWPQRPPGRFEPGPPACGGRRRRARAA